MLKRTIISGLLVISSFGFVSGALGATEISDGNVQAIYHLEDVVDSSGNGYNLTNTGTVTFGTAKLSNGADLGTANTTKYLSRASAMGLSSTASASACTWVEVHTAPSSGNTMQLIHWGTSSGNIALRLEYVNDTGTKKLRFNRTKPTVADQAVDYTVTLTPNTWYHVCIRYDYPNTTLKGYLDGAEVATLGSVSGTGGGGQPDTVNIGRNYNDFYYASAHFDETIIYLGVLSTTNITALYNSGNGSEVCNTGGCADTPTSTASTTDAFCDSPICTNVQEHLYLWITSGLFIIGAVLGFKIV